MTTPPTFSTAPRGYDRAEVDEHVARSAAALVAAQARADELEKALQEFRGELEAERARVHELAERVDRTPPPAAAPAAAAPAAAAPAAPAAAAPAAAVVGGPLRPLTAPSTPRALAPPLLTPPPLVPPTSARRDRDGDRARLLPLGAGLLAGALLGGGAVAAVDRDPAPARGPAVAGAPSARPSPSATPAAARSGAASPAASTVAAPPAAPTAVPAALAAPAALPRGWKRVQSGDGTWSIGVPPGWRSVGTGPTRRFVSASGLTTMTVRSGPVSGDVTAAAIRQQQRADATAYRGYRQLATRLLPFRGRPAGFWDFTYGSGAASQRVSDMALVVGQRGYRVHVQSRASAWRFAAPLVRGFRETLAVGG